MVRKKASHYSQGVIDELTGLEKVALKKLASNTDTSRVTLHNFKKRKCIGDRCVQKLALYYFFDELNLKTMEIGEATLDHSILGILEIKFIFDIKTLTYSEIEVFKNSYNYIVVISTTEVPKLYSMESYSYVSREITSNLNKPSTGLTITHSNTNLEAIKDIFKVINHLQNSLSILAPKTNWMSLNSIFSSYVEMLLVEEGLTKINKHVYLTHQGDKALVKVINENTKEINVVVSEDVSFILVYELKQGYFLKKIFFDKYEKVASIIYTKNRICISKLKKLIDETPLNP